MIALKWMILPAAILALHTMIILAIMAYKRVQAVKNSATDWRYFKLYRGYELPDNIAVWERHFKNLLEMPILFYAVITLAAALGIGGTLAIVFSWSYLLLRLAHTLIHLNGNRVLWRFRIFALSLLPLCGLWIEIIWQLFSARI